MNFLHFYSQKNSIDELLNKDLSHSVSNYELNDRSQVSEILSKLNPGDSVLYITDTAQYYTPDTTVILTRINFGNDKFDSVTTDSTFYCNMLLQFIDGNSGVFSTNGFNFDIKTGREFEITQGVGTFKLTVPSGNPKLELNFLSGNGRLVD